MARFEADYRSEVGSVSDYTEGDKGQLFSLTTLKTQTVWLLSTPRVVL